MLRHLSCSILLVAVVSLIGCSSGTPSPAAASPTGPSGSAAGGDEQPAATPAALVGKWRLDVKGEKSARTSVYDFRKDGRLVIETVLETPEFKVTDVLRSTVVRVEGDRITTRDVARRAGPDATEEELPRARQRVRMRQFEVKGDELHLTDLDEAGKPSGKSWVLKRIKE